MAPLITDAEFLKIRGLFRYLILYVLMDRPLHGYAIMKKISKLFDNDYTPSPGVLYPTLQLLEEMGLIESEMKGRRRIYKLTEQGRRLIEENRHQVEKFLERTRYIKQLAKETGLVRIVEVLRKLYEQDIVVPQSIVDEIKKHVSRIVELLESMTTRSKV